MYIEKLCANGVSDRHRVTAVFQADVLDLARRVLRLRRARRIGIVWCDAGRWWISDNEYDPCAERHYISLRDLKMLVSASELAFSRRPAQREATDRGLKQLLRPETKSA